MSADGDPRAVTFPLAQMSDGAPDFSFSGLKTSVSLYVKRRAPLGRAEIADVAASFQAAVVKMLVRKTVKAALHHGVKRLVLTGGVAANGHLRAGARGGRARARHRACTFRRRALCTDNAAMITAAGTARLAAGDARPAHPQRHPRPALAMDRGHGRSRPADSTC